MLLDERSIFTALCNIAAGPEEICFVPVARIQIPAGLGPGTHFWDGEWLNFGGWPGTPVHSISHCAPSALISPPFRRERKKEPEPSALKISHYT